MPAMTNKSASEISPWSRSRTTRSTKVHNRAAGPNRGVHRGGVRSLRGKCRYYLENETDCRHVRVSIPGARTHRVRVDRANSLILRVEHQPLCRGGRVGRGASPENALLSRKVGSARCRLQNKSRKLGRYLKLLLSDGEVIIARFDQQVEL